MKILENSTSSFTSNEHCNTENINTNSNILSNSNSNTRLTINTDKFSNENTDIDISITINHKNSDDNNGNDNNNTSNIYNKNNKLTINPAHNDINIDNSINNLSLSNFDTSLELKLRDLKQYALNKQNNLIAEWINKYIDTIPEEWIDIISLRITDTNNPGKISATVKEHKNVKKTRLIQAIIKQPKEYLSAFVQMYAQQAHTKFNHHTNKDSQSVCRMIDRINKKYGRDKQFWEKQFLMSDDVVGYYPSLSHKAIYNDSSRMLEEWQTERSKEYPEILEKLKNKNVIIAWLSFLCGIPSYAECSNVRRNVGLIIPHIFRSLRNSAAIFHQK